MTRALQSDVPVVVLFDCPPTVEMLTGLQKPEVIDVHGSTTFLRIGDEQLGTDWFYDEPESDELKIAVLRQTILKALDQIYKASDLPESSTERPAELVKLAILGGRWGWRTPFLSDVFDDLFPNASLRVFDGYNILPRERLRAIEQEDPLGLNPPGD